jgi:hypothetical protein
LKTSSTAPSIDRDNPSEFLEAAEQMCKAMQRFGAADPDADVPGLPRRAKDTIYQMLRTITDENGAKRHRKWLDALNEGAFGFPPVKVIYKDKGAASWKHQALGTRRRKDKREDKFPYDSSFLESDWKLFHDALLAHRLEVLHEILPRYGICAA